MRTQPMGRRSDPSPDESVFTKQIFDEIAIVYFCRAKC